MAPEKTIASSRSRGWFTALCLLSVLPLLALTVFPEHWRWLVLLHLLAQWSLIYSCVRPNCRWFGPVVTSFHTNRKEVWLTFDDGPCAEHLPGILALLKQFDARATFFVVGNRIQANGSVARQVIQAGHTIENHSATHPVGFFWALLPRAAEREIREGAKSIKAAIGTESRLFRAPVGMANYFVHAALQRLDKKLIGWSVRGFDSSGITSAENVVDRLCRSVKPGAIVLLHEEACVTKENQAGRSVLELLLSRLRKDGYACVIPDIESLRSRDVQDNQVNNRKHESIKLVRLQNE